MRQKDQKPLNKVGLVLYLMLVPLATWMFLEPRQIVIWDIKRWLLVTAIFALTELGKVFKRVLLRLKQKRLLWAIFIFLATSFLDILPVFGVGAILAFLITKIGLVATTFLLLLGMVIYFFVPIKKK